jgi:SOS-response transcriptional repressor LexA
MNVKENLAFLIDYRRTNANALAVAAGVPQPTVHRILTGESADPRTKTLERLAVVLGVTVADLRERNLAADLRQLPSSNVLTRSAGSRHVPLVGYSDALFLHVKKASVSEIHPKTHLLTDQQLSALAFALELANESMAPDFMPGDRVVVDPAIQPVPGDYVLARSGDAEVVFGKFRPRQDGTFELVALNPDYPTLSLSADAVIATMAEHRRYRRR